MAAQVTAFPMLPVFDGRREDEAAHAFGLRAFTFLVATRVPAGLLTSEELELALHASHGVVMAREMADVARDTLHAVRSDIIGAIERGRKAAKTAAADAAAVAVPVAAPTGANSGLGGDGGQKVRRVVPRPVLPSGGAQAAF